MTTGKPKTKRPHSEQDLREACVEEAFRVIGESGIDSLSLREVARRLGVSHQAPYKHFPSRDHILAEVVRRAYMNFAEYLEARSRSADPEEDLGNMGRAYLQYAREHPLHYTLMFETKKPDPAAHPEMMQQAKYAFSLLTEGLKRLPHRHDSARTPAELDALYVWSCLHGLASVMKGQALQTLSMPDSMLEHADAFVLYRIGTALSRPDEPA